MPERELTVINPAPAVVKHLIEVMEQEQIPQEERNASVRIEASGDSSTLEEIAALIEKSL